MSKLFDAFIQSSLALGGFILLFISSVQSKDTFTEISDAQFSNIDCVPYAYGDFNADKRIDIFCVSNQGVQIEIWLAQEKEPLFSQFKKFSLKDKSIIASIVPGDYDGDSVMDLLVVSKTKKMSLFLGDKKSRYTNDLRDELYINANCLDQPFTADLNGDGKIDLICETDESKSELKTFVFNQNGSVSESRTYQTKNRLYNGFAHSIADVDNNLMQDLVLTVKSANDETPIYEVWSLHSSNDYSMIDSYNAPPGLAFYGQSLFADFDSDGQFEHLLPACIDNKCEKSIIYMRKDKTWNELPIEFGIYSFIPPSEQNDDFWNVNPISVKAGDYNLNGYIDLMVILKINNKNESTLAGDNKKRYAVLLNNIPLSDRNDKQPTYSRTFKIDSHILSLFAYDKVAQASFFDLYDDGYLDILIVVKNENNNYKLIALKNEYYDDVYFLKVMVIPGRCNVRKCPSQSLPYGLNYPGALVKIESISYEYERIIIYASQLSQSSYMALQLPYTIFGLGATPNFVEHLNVYMSSLTANDQIRSVRREWPQIIPNSQLVISPNPRDYSFNWKMQLFITPSNNILLTAIALTCTMIGLIIVIGALQYREKKMDEKERKLESQRFHFDGL